MEDLEVLLSQRMGLGRRPLERRQVCLFVHRLVVGLLTACGVSRNLSPEDFQYLSSLPLVIHLPSIHTFMVHAGLLPMDPAHHLRSGVQPLAHAPESLPENPTAEDIERARYVSFLPLHKLNRYRLTPVPQERARTQPSHRYRAKSESIP